MSSRRTTWRSSSVSPAGRRRFPPRRSCRGRRRGRDARAPWPRASLRGTVVEARERRRATVGGTRRGPARPQRELHAMQTCVVGQRQRVVGLQQAVEAKLAVAVFAVLLQHLDLVQRGAIAVL